LPDNHDFRLFQGITTVGIKSSNDLVFNNESVSRNHAKIIEENNVFRLYDLGSTAGTWLNGRMVREPEILESDDVIRFGDDVEVKFISEKLR
jgi:pSer/pThr/pTyr-binding forkhead associated (FHA) protein